MRDLVGVPKGCLFRKQVICERISLTQLVCLDAAFGPYLREMTVIRQVLCNTYATVSPWPILVVTGSRLLSQFAFERRFMYVNREGRGLSWEQHRY